MKSEIEVPEGWELKKLDDLSTIKGRVGWRGYTVDDLRDSGPITLGANNISNSNKIILGNLTHLSKEKYEESPEIFVKRGDILVVQRGSLGKIGFINFNIGEATINPSMILVKNITISNQYLYYYLCSKSIQKRINSFKTQTGVPMISQKQCKNLKILAPPKREQQKIADILSKVDEQIGLIEKIIDKTEELKKGLMQKLLTKGIGHTRFKQTELGEIPEEWEVVKTGDYADITKLAGFEYTKYFNSYKDGGKIIVMRGTNITNNELNLSNIRTIPKETSEKLPRSQLKKGDLVFAYVGTIGPVYLIKETNKFHLGPNTARITVNENIDSQYAFHYFTSHLLKREIFRQISVSAQPSLSMAKIRSFRFVLPKSKDEQKQIASILSKVDEQIQDNKKELKHLHELKKGLMQDLLTGNVRVTT